MLASALPERTIKRRLLPAEDNLPGTLHPVVHRIYAARHLLEARQLEYSLDNIPGYTTLKDIDKAVVLLAQALTEKHPIVVVADYDADGATGCAVMVRALTALCGNVSYVVPSRFKHGYGLTQVLLEELIPRHAPWLIVTVDNGTNSIEAIAHLRHLQIKVIVIDHHVPGEELPAADALINPKQPGDQFPGKNLAAVGVALYTLIALRAHLREKNWFVQHGITEPNFAALLDLVALGTVADQVPLDYLNRVLVHQGLARIRAGKSCPGISGLIKTAGLDSCYLQSSDLAFSIAPRLNAAGRLTEMEIGIRCLLSKHTAEALPLAEELGKLNRQRRTIQHDMQSEAMEILRSMSPIDTNGRAANGVVLYNANWHAGVSGILASKVKELFNVPVVVFASAQQGTITGSARSISGIHIRDLLALIDAIQPQLITRFGGHAMAAGLTIASQDLALFKELFEQETGKLLTEELQLQYLLTDGELSTEEFTLDFAELLEVSGPWGQGFPEPLFDGIFEIVHHRIVGDGHLQMEVSLPGRSDSYRAIFFNAPEAAHFIEGRAMIAYRLAVNRYRNNPKVQLIVQDIKAL